MFPPPPSGELPDKLQLTLIMRLVLTREGELEHGEIVDLAGTVLGRFKGWSGALALVHEAVSSYVNG